MKKRSLTAGKPTSRMGGFSIIEILVSLVISLFILAGAVTILVHSQRNYRQNDDFGRLQENARFAMEMITSDLRLAGFFGCSTKVYNHLNSTDGDLFDTTQAIDGFEEGGSAWEGQGNTDIVASIWPGTDAITIRKFRNAGTPILDNMTATDALIEIANAPVNVNQLAAIYNCNSTDIFQVTSSDTSANTLGHAAGGSFSPGNSSDALSAAYDQNNAYISNTALVNASKTYVTAYEPVRYYIAASTANAGRPALWRQLHDGSGAVSQELIEGIENMQLLYGLDVNNADRIPDVYVDADNVPDVDGDGLPDWSLVLGVKVTLLVSTLDEYGGEIDTKTYDIYSTPADDSDDVGPFNDRRSRKLISSTVLLRNLQIK
jgi:type IV pilus assembly protein PilW